ncbi:MAG: aspartyl/asparaginyl beta-hydroxylase domain-containing protein [Bryobacteraceae bacterium]
MASPTSTTALHGFLLQLGAHDVSHSGRSLYEHLCGVNSILRAWEQPESICNAGMFHSIYSTEKFRHTTLSMNERPRLQAAIGEEAERLVYLFATLPRTAVLEAANSWLPFSSAAYAEIPCHGNGKIVVQVSKSELTNLVLLHMANRVEQASKPATGIGFWLSRISELVTNLRAFSDTDLPKVLADLGTITVDDERRLNSLYLQGINLLQNDDPRGALAYLDGACRDYGFVGEPYLMLAVGHALLGESELAREAACKGRALLKSWGAPWHKRLSMESWYMLADRITDNGPIEDMKTLLRGISVAHDKAQALADEETGVESNGSGSLITARQADASRFFSYLKAVQIHRSKRAIKWYPGLSRKDWYDPAQFPVTRELESHFDEIKAEALEVEPGYYYEEAENIGRTGNWQVCMFYEQGRRNDLVCRQCPRTAAIIEGNDSIRRTAGLIYLSKMAPHTHVAAHQARGNIRLRCHLALRIPRGDCAIRVGDQVHHWEEGKCIVFDDTFEHEVWNRTDEERLVLLIDLWHPDLTQLERDALDTINWLSTAIASGMVGTWQRNDSQRGREGKFGVKQPEDLFD